MLGTARFMDSIGYFGDGVPNLLQGTVPFSAYQAASVYTYTGGQNPNNDQLYCRDLWTALGGGNVTEQINRTAVADINQYIGLSIYNASEWNPTSDVLKEFNTDQFLERRVS